MSARLTRILMLLVLAGAALITTVVADGLLNTVLDELGLEVFLRVGIGMISAAFSVWVFFPYLSRAWRSGGDSE